MPTPWVEKSSEFGAKLNPGGSALPIPLRETNCGELVAVLVMTIEPNREPEAEGWTVTLSVQLAPGPMDSPHVSSEVKSPDCAPVNDMLEPDVVAAPTLVSVTTRAALSVPVFWAPKSIASVD